MGIVLSLLLSILCFLQFYFNCAYFDDSNWTFSLWNCSQILSCVWALVTIKMVKYLPAREWNWILGIGIVVGLYLVTFINLIDFYFAMALVYAVYSIILYDISQKLTVNPIQEETQITYKNFAWVKKEMNKHCYVMSLNATFAFLWIILFSIPMGVMFMPLGAYNQNTFQPATFGGFIALFFACLVIGHELPYQLAPEFETINDLCDNFDGDKHFTDIYYI